MAPTPVAVSAMWQLPVGRAESKEAVRPEAGACTRVPVSGARMPCAASQIGYGVCRVHGATDKQKQEGAGKAWTLAREKREERRNKCR